MRPNNPNLSGVRLIPASFRLLAVIGILNAITPLPPE